MLSWLIIFIFWSIGFRINLTSLFGASGSMYSAPSVPSSWTTISSGNALPKFSTLDCKAYTNLNVWCDLRTVQSYTMTYPGSDISTQVVLQMPFYVKRLINKYVPCVFPVGPIFKAPNVLCSIVFVMLFSTYTWTYIPRNLIFNIFCCRSRTISVGANPPLLAFGKKLTIFEGIVGKPDDHLIAKFEG